jgi:hypothetical protein
MKTRVVICGGSGGEAWLAVRAWQARAGGHELAVYCDDPVACQARAQALDVEAVVDRAALFDDPTMVSAHLLGGLRGRDDLLAGLLGRGLIVLAAPPVCERGDSTRILASAGPGLLRDGAVLPWLPAFAEGLRRVHANHIGRLQQVRLRSVVAGQGGWDPGLNPGCPLRDSGPQSGFEATLRRELAAALPLAEAVLGPIVEVHVQAPRREPPYSVLVTWRHRDHARHGCLELTVSPAMPHPSPFAPRDDSVEITGTAGILWVGGLRGGPSVVPPLRIYRGDTLLEPEPPAGGWPVAWARMVRASPALEIARLQHRQACLDAALASLESGDRIAVA